MPVGLKTLDTLPQDHREALLAATDILIDACIGDIARLDKGEDFRLTYLETFLPGEYLAEYDSFFTRKFLACLFTVAWKLRSPETHSLACVGEQLAMNAIIQLATAILENEGKEADYSGFADTVFEGRDFELLFQPSVPWPRPLKLAQSLHSGNLSIREWFKAFKPTDPVHPYLEKQTPEAVR